MKSPSFNDIPWYTEQWDILGIYLVYFTVYARHIHQFGLIDLSQQRKRRSCHHETELACTDHYKCWGHDFLHQNAFFIQHECLTGIYQVYTKYIYLYHITYGAILRAFLVSQARLDVSGQDFLRIRSVLATEGSPTLGWGLPKFHIQSLIS